MKQEHRSDDLSLPFEPLQAFLRRMRAFPGKRLTNSMLWEFFGETFPYRPGGAENRKWLLVALQEAADQGMIQWPSLRGSSWERTLEPPLPTFVWKTQQHEARYDENWREYPWLPQLDWVRQLPTLSQEYAVFLKRVQHALREGVLQQQAPMKYRSLQLTGDEKRLGDLIHTPLFRPGRLSLALLGCIPEILPLVLEEIGDSPIALVFENAAAFRTASQVLQRYQHSPYGLLGFGAGRGFERSILHFHYVHHPLTHIEYVGDLDRPGLHIARGAARLAQAEGLPPILPASGFHRAMLISIQQFGYPEGLEYQKKEQRKDSIDKELCSWLPADVREECLTIIQAGKRIPEEVLGPDELQCLWQTFLRRTD